jgi:hypothetical protein
VLESEHAKRQQAYEPQHEVPQKARQPPAPDHEKR